MCSYVLFLVHIRLLSGHLLRNRCHSVDHMFSLYFDYLEYQLFPVLVLRAGSSVLDVYFYALVSLSNSHPVCIFMNINENLKVEPLDKLVTRWVTGVN